MQSYNKTERFSPSNPTRSSALFRLNSLPPKSSSFRSGPNLFPNRIPEGSWTHAALGAASKTPSGRAPLPLWGLTAAGGLLAAVVGFSYTAYAASAAENSRGPNKGYRPTQYTRLQRRFFKFASVEPADQDEGEWAMSEQDFIRSILPDGSDQLTAPLVSSICALYMSKEDPGFGNITLPDYVMIDALLSRSKAALSMAWTMFDSDGDGYLTRDEFRHVLLANRRAKSITYDFDNSKIIAHFFGQDGSGRISWSQFYTFFASLQREVLRQEFVQYDTDKDGFIDARAFSELMMSRVVPDEMPRYMVKRLASINAVSGNSHVSFADVLAFHVLVRNMDQFDQALSLVASGSGDAVTKAGFRRAAKSALGVDISPTCVDLIFHVFDRTNSGNLDRVNFTRLIRYRRDIQLEEVKSPLPPGESSWLKSLLHGARSFGLGGIAGAIGATAVYPIDLVKTRMQNQRTALAESAGSAAATTAKNVAQNAAKQGEAIVYRNAWHCFRVTLANEGFIGLYRGLGPQLVGVAPEKAIKLVVNDTLRSLFEDQNRPGEVFFPLEVLAGAGAGGCQVIVTNPLEIIKIRLQVQGEIARETGAKPKGAIAIMRELGVSGLYRGSAACFMRDIPFSGLYFPAYAKLKEVFKDDHGHTGALEMLAAGSLAGVLAASSTTPADVIKTRLQVEARAGQTTYNGIRDAAVKIYRAEGMAAFWKGVIPRTIRSSPQFGLTLVSYELLQASFADRDSAVPTVGLSPTNVPVTQRDVDIMTQDRETNLTKWTMTQKPQKGGPQAPTSDDPPSKS